MYNKVSIWNMATEKEERNLIATEFLDIKNFYISKSV